MTGWTRQAEATVPWMALAPDEAVYGLVNIFYSYRFSRGAGTVPGLTILSCSLINVLALSLHLSYKIFLVSCHLLGRQ